MRVIANYCLNTFISFRGKETPTSRRYEYKVIVWLWRMTNHPTYRAVFIIITIVNVGVISESSVHIADESEEDLKSHLNLNSTILLLSNIAFLLELIIKLIALEWKVFWAQRLNIVDLALSLVFVTLFIIDQNQAEAFSFDHATLYFTNMYAFLSTLRILRLIMVAQVSK